MSNHLKNSLMTSYHNTTVILQLILLLVQPLGDNVWANIRVDDRGFFRFVLLVYAPHSCKNLFLIELFFSLLTDIVWKCVSISLHISSRALRWKHNFYPAANKLLSTENCWCWLTGSTEHTFILREKKEPLSTQANPPQLFHTVTDLYPRL